MNAAVENGESKRIKPQSLDDQNLNKHD
jgi:hypothetical protein